MAIQAQGLRADKVVANAAEDGAGIGTDTRWSNSKLHFTEAEFAERRRRAADELSRQGLAGLLIFRQETMYYLTGYDTAGFHVFQCLYLGADGRLVLLTRLPNLMQARRTSMIEDIRIWTDGDQSDPTAQVRDILSQAGCAGETLGIELDTIGITVYWHERLKAALDGFCKLTDASDLVGLQRAIKSPAELVYVRKAAELADAALAEANRLAVPGVFEGDILAAMQGVFFRNNGDHPAMEFIIGSGRDALLCRHFSGRGHLGDNDQMTLEFAGSYRRYHTPMMRTVMTGQVSDRQRDMYKACREALVSCQAAMVPGTDFGTIFDIHAKIMDDAGFKDYRLNACGYGVGATFQPSWVDWPMAYSGNTQVVQPGMTIFLHPFLMDAERGLTMSIGETTLITEKGPERLSGASLDLVVN